MSNVEPEPSPAPVETPAPTPKSRAWVFTINNWTEDEFYLVKNTTCTYLVMGKEIAPTTGTPHLQGFVYFKALKSMASIKAAAGWARASLRIKSANSTFAQAADYCKKEGQFVELGECPAELAAARAAGGASTADKWREALEQSRQGLEVEDSMIAFLHYKAINHHREAHLCRMRNLTDTTQQMLWYWGEARTGKSRKARTDNPDAYLKSCNKWWDGYQAQEVVIIEDLDRAHDCLAHHLKVWADRYKFPAEYKGGMFVIRPRVIIVTSNWSIADIWQEEQSREPLESRFKQVEFKKLRVRQTQLSTAPPPPPPSPGPGDEQEQDESPGNTQVLEPPPPPPKLVRSRTVNPRRAAPPPETLTGSVQTVLPPSHESRGARYEREIQAIKVLVDLADASEDEVIDLVEDSEEDEMM